MKKFGSLTIGIISRNGQPFIENCLLSFSTALDQLLRHFVSIDFILVDSDSSDNTLRVMADFAKLHQDKSIKTDVYLLEGNCNAAIARNIILGHATGDIVFLCDGDIVVNGNFLITASEKIISGKSAQRRRSIKSSGVTRQDNHCEGRRLARLQQSTQGWRPVLF